MNTYYLIKMLIIAVLAMGACVTFGTPDDGSSLSDIDGAERNPYGVIRDAAIFLIPVGGLIFMVVKSL
jgi:hypothetical protein